MGPALRPPRPDEQDALTDLCLRAKAVHGYDADFMAACRAELTVDEVSLGRGPAQVAAHALSDEPLGFAQVSMTGGVCELEAMFVAPERIGQGIGRLLFTWSAGAAMGLGATGMVIAADPGAEAFYLAMGAVRAGEIASVSIPGRFLPRLVYPLSERGSAPSP